MGEEELILVTKDRFYELLQFEEDHKERAKGKLTLIPSNYLPLVNTIEKLTARIHQLERSMNPQDVPPWEDDPCHVEESGRPRKDHTG